MGTVPFRMLSLLSIAIAALSLATLKTGTRRILLFVASTLAGLLFWAAPALAQTTPVVFTRATLPEGVATDGGGNVYVNSDATFTTLITKYSPTAAPIWRQQIGGITVGELGHMATDPATGVIWHVANNGNVRLINPNTGQVFPNGNLRQISVDTSRIYDMTTGRVGPMAGLVIPQFATYSDISLLRRGNLLDIFITGKSSAFPFVMRIRFVSNNFQSARVVISSRATAAPNDNLPRGVAANPRGAVLTSLPLPPNRVGTGNFDRAVRFSADLPENLQRPVVGLGGRDLTSRGMTADSLGNFYVATGRIGTSLCGAGGSGALVRVTPDVSRFACRTLGVTLADSKDIALSPNQTLAYMPISNLNVVARMTRP